MMRARLSPRAERDLDLIFYQPFENTIVVVRILHAARDWTRFFPASSRNAG